VTNSLDAELLKAAAKTAGLRIIGWTSGGLAVLEGERYWQPLERDADALRLAFACRLNTDFYKVDDTEGVLVEDWDGNEVDEEFEAGSGGGLAAWRRAIVRAAAAQAGTTGGAQQ
jgi:hypothetical protein